MTPQESYLQDFAAYLFWNVAAEDGVAGAVARFEANEEDWARKTHLIQKSLEEAGPVRLSAGDIDVLVADAVKEIRRYSARGMNITGVIYADDRAALRSPSAMELVIPKLQAPRVSSKSAQSMSTLQKAGQLCLRHPLPAVVFTSVAPDKGKSVLQVADTTRALGFPYPLFLTGIRVHTLAEGALALTGMFVAPIQDDRASAAIKSCIPNCMLVRGGFTAGEHTFEFDWD